MNQQEKKQSIETSPKMTQMLNKEDKVFKASTINMLKESNGKVIMINIQKDNLSRK